MTSSNASNCSGVINQIAIESLKVAQPYFDYSHTICFWICKLSPCRRFACYSDLIRSSIVLVVVLVLVFDFDRGRLRRSGENEDEDEDENDLGAT